MNDQNSVLNSVKTIESLSLSAKEKKASKSYKTAQKSLQAFLADFKAGKIKTRGKFKTSLTLAIDNLTMYVKDTGVQRAHYPIRKLVKYILNVLKTILDDHEDKSLTPPAVKALIKRKITPKLLEIFEVAEDIIDVDPTVEKKGLSDVAEEFITVRESVRKYQKYQRKIPNKLRRPEAFQVAEVPILAAMPGSLRNPATLKHIKIPHTVVGQGINAIGIVFEKQNVLMFSKKHALADAKTMFIEEAEDSGLDGGKLKESKKTAKASITSKFKLIAQSLNLTRGPEISAWVKEMKTLTPAARDNFDYKGLVKKTFKRDLRDTVLSVITPIAKEISALYNSLETIDKQERETKSRFNKVKKTKQSSSNILLRYASAAVSEISKQSGHDYDIISTIPQFSPRNADIVMYWIVSTVFYKVLRNYAGEEIDGITWSLPWSQKKSKASREVPADVNSLQVKYGSLTPPPFSGSK